MVGNQTEVPRRITVRRLTRALILVSLAAAIEGVGSGTAWAQGACDQQASSASYLFLGIDASCQIQPTTVIPTGPTNLMIINVSLATTPVSAVRFAIPDPPVGSIQSINWNFPHVGSLATGVEIDLQGCSAQGTLVLGEILLEVPTTLTDCALWGMDPVAEVDDCNGQTLAVTPWYQYLNQSGDCIGSCFSWQWCAPFPPSNLLPADGSTDVPLDTQPSGASGYGGGFLYITSDPSCENYDEFYLTAGEPWLPADYLAPETTYHWYVVEFYQCSNVSAERSAVQSFTTAGVVAAVQQPWSIVKTLFR